MASTSATSTSPSEPGPIPGEAGAKATNGVDDDGNGFIDDVHGWDFCNDDNTVHDPGEDGHGTHVAGTIAASLERRRRRRRRARRHAHGPQVHQTTLGHRAAATTMAIDAIDYAREIGVQIINASWGGAAERAVLQQAIAESGALFVAAAGNDNATSASTIDLGQPAVRRSTRPARPCRTS